MIIPCHSCRDNHAYSIPSLENDIHVLTHHHILFTYHCYYCYCYLVLLYYNIIVITTMTCCCQYYYYNCHHCVVIIIIIILRLSHEYPMLRSVRCPKPPVFTRRTSQSPRPSRAKWRPPSTLRARRKHPRDPDELWPGNQRWKWQIMANPWTFSINGGVFPFAPMRNSYPTNIAYPLVNLVHWQFATEFIGKSSNILELDSQWLLS